MPTYCYFCEECQEEFEEMHSITEQLEECPKCKSLDKTPCPPKRLISNGTNFVLVGGRWAKDSYS